MKFRCLVSGVFLTAVLLPAQRQLIPTHDDINVPLIWAGRLPRWNGARLVGCDCGPDHATLWSVDRQGHWSPAISFGVPGWGQTIVRDVAAEPDGTLVAVGFAITGDVRNGSFIATISPDGARQTVTRVWPYVAEAVTVAPDGTIWAVGPVMHDDYKGPVYPNVLRHYTASAEMLSSVNIKNARKSEGGLSSVGSQSVLMASGDRIGWLTAACQYIEFSSDGTELGRYDCPNGITKIFDTSGVALSPAGELLLSTKWFAPLAPLSLDRPSGTWKPVPVSQDSGKTNLILGFDGQTLVTESATSDMRRYTWGEQSPATGQ